MGNSSNNLKGLDPRFQEIGIDENELLSTLIVVRDKKSQEKILIRQVNLASQPQYNRIFKELKQRKTLSDKKLGQYLIRLREVEGKEQSEVCGKSFKLLLYLEYLAGNLKSIYNERLRTNRPFEEDQLYRILKGIVNGLIILHDNNFKNIHLSKESIVISSQNTYKMIDTQLCNRVHPYFQILNGVPPKPGTYIAPQLLSDIKKGGAEYYHSTKADIFTLAVLLLEMATLTYMDKYFDYEAKVVDVPGLRKVAQNLPLSGSIRDILLCMLRQSQQDRIGLLSLRQLLSSPTLDTFPNEELLTYKSICDTNGIKQSGRTFISRSKNQSFQRASSPNRTQSPTNKVGQPAIPVPVATQQFSQHISSIALPNRNTQPQVITSSRPPLISPTYAPLQNRVSSPPPSPPRMAPPPPRQESQPAPIVTSTKSQHTHATFTFTNSVVSRPTNIPPPQQNLQLSPQHIHQPPPQQNPPPPSSPHRHPYHNISPNISFPPANKYEPRYDNSFKNIEEQRQPLRDNDISAKITESKHVTEPMIPIRPESMKVMQAEQTPKGQYFNNFKKVSTREFQTPVDILNQTQPEPFTISTPVHKVQQKKTIIQELDMRKTLPEKFSNRAYRHLDFQNGARYEGQFNPEGQFEGNGVLYYPSGKVCYSGSWKGNSFNGFGVLHNESTSDSKEETPYWSFNLSQINWLYYEGEFNMDHKEGFGTLHMANGDKFSGCFKNDAVEGFGTFYLKQEQKNINGIWLNNVLKH